MAYSTGPDSNSYTIPYVQYGDNFSVWMDTTNTQSYKLNKLQIYAGLSSSSIGITVSSGGTFGAELADNIGKGVTFSLPVTFMSGVTFNGNVTFNATTFTVNANAVTIDDYNIVLGDTAAGSSDTKITAAGGGGILINRGSSGSTAQWLWTPISYFGITGIWSSPSHIGLGGGTAGIVPYLNGVLPVHGSSVLLDGGQTGEHAFSVSLTTSSGKTGGERDISFSRVSPEGSTAFIDVLFGSTYGSRPFVRINDGANRKIVTQTSHLLTFGTPVRFENGTGYVKALATDGTNAEVVGVVSRYIDTNTFELTFIGEIFGDFRSVNGGSDLIPGSTYYLSPYSTGTVTAVQPTAAGIVHKAVYIATSATSAVVIPFTGGVLASPLNIANSSSLSTRIFQANQFSVGDVVRFKYYPSGVTLNYKTGAAAGASLNQNHPYGVYVKAQANTPEEAEIAGMVVAVSGVTGTSPHLVNTAFDVLMDGFFDISGAAANFSVGQVYFLNKNAVGASACLESTTDSFVTSPPTEFGMVRKPLFMSTSPQAGYLFSYRGDIRSEVSISGSTTDITRLLVTDIRDGISGDLVIGSYNGNQNGREAARISAGKSNYEQSQGRTGGLIGIGGGFSRWDTGSNIQNRIMTELDVNGTVRVGKTLASTPQGQDILVVRNTGDDVSGVTMISRMVIGTDYSDGNLVIGRGVRPKVGGAGYDSTIGSGLHRSALVIGASGTDGSALRWRTAANSSAALGTSVTMTDVFSIVGITSSFYGPITTNSPVRISSTGVYPTATSTPAYNRVLIGGTAPNLLIWNDGQAAAAGLYSQLGLGVKSSANPLLLAGGFVHGGNENTSDSSGFLAFNTTPTDGSSNRERMRIDSKGNVGIGTTAPISELHVHSSGAGAGINTGLYLTQGATPTVGSSNSSVWQIIPTLLAGVTALQIIDRVNSIRRAVFGTDGSVALGGSIEDDNGLNATLLLSADQKVTSRFVGELRNTISFSMVYQSAYSGQWHGCSKPANSNVITLPAGTWQGYVWSVPAGGTPVTMTSFSAISGSITVNPGTMGSGYYMNVHITRVS